jgi:hypothetical protein
VIRELTVGVTWRCGLGGEVGNFGFEWRSGGRTWVAGGHGMCCGIWPLDGFAE